MDTQPILEQFRHLDVEKKLEFLERLWEEIVADPDCLPLSDHHRRLLDKRLQQHEESPEDIFDWGDVKAEALNRLSR